MMLDWVLPFTSALVLAGVISKDHCRYVKKYRSLFHRRTVMSCAIWHRLCNFKNVKNTHGGVLLLVKL